MRSNQRFINDVSVFSDEQELRNALLGRYCKDYQDKYKLSIIKNVCIINTLDDCTIEIPDHYSFAYEDEDGRHICSENENTLSVFGISTIVFHVRNTQ